MTITVDELRLEDLDEDSLRELVGLVNRSNREAMPRWSDVSVQEFVTMATSPGWIRSRFAARSEDGTLLGEAEGRHSADGTSPDILWAGIRVAPQARRSGVGSLLLKHLTELAAGLSRPWMKWWVFDTVPAGAAFVEAIGGSTTLDHHENILAISDIDWKLMEEWVELGRSRANEYEVVVHDDGWPDELNEGMAHLYYILERDMPMADGFEPREWSAEKVEEMLAHYAQTTESITAVAMTRDGGTPVGMSQLMRRLADPSTWIVTTTMVDPEHRGRALGKWVKGAVNLAARERWTGGVYQETGNAFTNEAMLAINRQMGFVHELTTTDVQVTVEQARSYLQRRGL